jgi:ferrochelatase
MPRAATPDCVAKFLRELVADPLVVDHPQWLWKPILERSLGRRIEQLAEQYREIWEGEQPAGDRGTQAIAAALQAAVGNAASVRPAYRYGEPSLVNELRDALSAGHEVTVLPLFPQRMSATSETIAQAATRIAETRGEAGRLEVARIAPDEPAYIFALAERVLAAQARAYIAPEHFVLSFPALQRRYNWRERARYYTDCDMTMRALIDAIDVPVAHVTVCFQSRFGRDPSVGPSLCSVLRSLGRKGVKSVAVATPGFLTEGLDTRVEASTRGRRVFLEAGGKDYVVAKPIETHPVFVGALARTLVPEAFQPIPEQTAKAS